MLNRALARTGSTQFDAVLDEVATWQQRPLDAVYR